VSLEGDLRTYLLTKTGVTNLVTTTGVYVGRIPRAARYPVIGISRVSGGHEHVLSGAAGYATPRIQLDVWSTSMVTTLAVAEAVRQVMQGFKGTMGSTTVSSVVLENEIDLTEEPDDGSDLGIEHRVLDYFIRYTESIPSL
jgi:hypothetical protein